jgi:hypothetical protein
MSSAAPAQRISTRTAALCAIGWGILVAAGFVGLARYKTTAGSMAETPARWPEGTRLVRDAGRPTLVMFAHPRCACTRASLAELNRLAAERSFDSLVVFLSPAGVPADFVQSDLWRSAVAIPRARVMRDEGGAEAARFGAGTSGATLLYASDGSLLFRGGITPARGHEGNSFGRERILALLDGRPADRRDAPVFGCQLAEASGAKVSSAQTDSPRGNP